MVKHEILYIIILFISLLNIFYTNSSIKSNISSIYVTYMLMLCITKYIFNYFINRYSIFINIMITK